MAELWVPSSARKDEGDSAVFKALSRGRTGAVDDPLMGEMRRNRQVAKQRLKGSSLHAQGMTNINFATGRPKDPFFYWQQNNLPFDIWQGAELAKIRKLCRALYLTHPTIAACIDIFAKYPLSGMELTCKDEALTEFYTTLFFEQLHWKRYSKSIGREYWTVGEAWPFGSFNDALGVWEDDELLNPDDIEVVKSPFLAEPRFEMRLPQVLRDILEKRAPAWEYEKLVRAYPELQGMTQQDARMPVSNVLLRQLKFEADTFHPRGLPILMRAFRSVMQEEMLNAAQDAIADRLYTPLVLAKLGASATDLGTNSPWVPTDDDIMDFEEALDAALAADFRVLVHNFAIEMDTVFGRETMPNFAPDFDRLVDKQLTVFGLSRTAISGSAGGETYAGDALNRDYVTQLLTDYQDIQKDLFRERALVVAEAQEHFDYEERGGKRYVIMEEVLEVDEESGEQRIVEQPKLLVPDLKIQAMNMQDDEKYRQLVEALRSGGVPISQKTRLVNIPIDLEAEAEALMDEQVAQAVQAQEVRKRTYIQLKAAGLPIPDDLRQDFEPKAQISPEEQQAAGQQPEPEPGMEGTIPIPTVGTTEPADTIGLAPTPEDYDATQQPIETGTAAPGSNVIELPRNRSQQRKRPPESDEQRARMPKSSALAVRDDEKPVPSFVKRPAHLGSRRYADIKKDIPLDEQLGS